MVFLGCWWRCCVYIDGRLSRSGSSIEGLAHCARNKEPESPYRLLKPHYRDRGLELDCPHLPILTILLIQFARAESHGLSSIPDHIRVGGFNLGILSLSPPSTCWLLPTETVQERRDSRGILTQKRAKRNATRHFHDPCA
ncbi:uncharacterized protein BO66DRAFT_236560 [Aspergillus aculeatinus CBS 121060]|uniref:Uncharacterized protein n=1 Tax=Aspergillus aculeatinus CBS 121060 TaxID=1448322 RepID=A0ACD1HHM4_9EURO|nr:hypothetical protein BO66DRAFT_236560 [Aspergillus aculeatinus CBS 121060]RAH73162.1 hypothetical protein BO66DRAFT_236560 [Aspergillus aculeatinus CBS 121060]